MYIQMSSLVEKLQEHLSTFFTPDFNINSFTQLLHQIDALEKRDNHRQEQYNSYRNSDRFKESHRKSMKKYRLKKKLQNEKVSFKC